MDVKPSVEDKYQAINFVASLAPEAEGARERLVARYGDVSYEEADVVVALGGDGTMLQTLHRTMSAPKPVYGMNRGSLGFLMNDFSERGLRARLAAAQSSIIHPLLMRTRDAHGEEKTARAINEVSLWRQKYQAAKIEILVDGHVRLAELVADGVLVATPAGSTAYNLSASGPILPWGSRLMALTPICVFRPRRWRGALLPDRAQVAFEILESEKRPVAAAADHIEIRDVLRVDVETDYATSLILLHDAGHPFDERTLREQFGV
jgi:NAD+ kinase